MNAMVMPRTTSSETSRFVGFTMVCGAVLAAFFVTVVAMLVPSLLGSVSVARKQCRSVEKTFPGMVRGTADPSASPDFLLNLVALANFMRLSLLKGAHVALSCAACQ